MTCEHKWKIIEDRIIQENLSPLFIFTQKTYYWQIYTLQCIKCGDLEHRRHSLFNSYTNNEKGGVK